MFGKVCTFITAFSFITFVHHVQSQQSNCIPNDIKIHLDDLLLEEHMFEIKVFSPETRENELLSVINTLCSTWTNNKKKEKLLVIETFKLMLNYFSDDFERFCANHNCTDAYTLKRVNTVVFGHMYKNSCNGSISDLKCPSKSITISPSISDAQSTTFFTTVDSMTTANKSMQGSTSLTTVSPIVTTPEMHTDKNEQNLWRAINGIKTCSAMLILSVLLNIVLFLLMLKYRRDFQKYKPTRVNSACPNCDVETTCI